MSVGPTEEVVDDVAFDVCCDPTELPLPIRAEGK